jgi:3-oxoadipate enol-lactonase
MALAEIQVEGCRLSYEVEGPRDAPVLLFSNGLGTTISLWDAQLSALGSRFRVVRYDLRGHGGSKSLAGPYTLDDLGGDALALLDALRVERAHVCGISLGGLTAMWLALRVPQRVDRLVLANTAARIGSADLWEERIRSVEKHGVSVMVDVTLKRWFGAGFRSRRPEVVEDFREMLEGCPRAGYLGCCEALRDADLREAVSGITAPTLIVVGTSDTSTPPADGEWLRERIPGAQLLAIDAGHLSNVEQSDAFNAAVFEFLST